MIKGLPSPKPGAADIAKLTTGIGAALAALWFPAAALAAPFLSYAIDKFIERPQRILIQALKEGDLDALSDEQAAEFVPMAYRFMEAAKQGEYERTLKVLAAFIVGELGEKLPDAGNFARMARRLEAMSKEELQVIASVAAWVRQQDVARDQQSFVLNALWDPSNGTEQQGGVALDGQRISLCLAELTNRGLLRTVWVTTFGGGDARYFPTESFWELIDKAGSLAEAESASG